MPFSTIMDSNSFTGTAAVDPATRALIDRRRALLGPAYRLFYDRPVHLVRGEGAYLFDADGTRYLDAYNNVAGVGHANPRVTEAVSRQLATLNTHTRYLHDGVLEYSQRLLATLPEACTSVMFTCTGSEANDLAVRVAEQYTGGSGVVVTEQAYHGNSALTSALSPSLGAGVALGPAVRTVPAPDSYRTPAAQLSGSFAAHVSAAIADLERHGHRFSALLIDSVFSSDGIYPDASVLADAADVARRAGGVLIADEVQAGFGRTGERMWGFQRHAVVPDLVTMGKPMGNGTPIGAMAARPDVLAPFAENIPYFNTFGGNPVSIAAAGAVLDIVEQDGLADHARLVGEQLRCALSDVGAQHPVVGDVRGTGLYLGVEIVTDPESRAPDRSGARHIVNALRERNILISVCGGDGNVLKIRPPLVFSSADVDWFVTEFAAVVAEVSHPIG